MTASLVTEEVFKREGFPARRVWSDEVKSYQLWFEGKGASLVG